MHNQPSVDCASPPEVDTAGDLAITGVNPSDIVGQDFTAPVVLNP